MSRAVGIKRDLRLSKLETYANYYYLNFRSYIGHHGDCYDRFLIRMNEMAECTNIITQAINSVTKYNQSDTKTKNINLQKFNSYSNILPHQLLQYILPKHINKYNYKNSYISMEHLINHFKYWSEGFNVKSNLTYQAIEAPKGEFGVTLLADDTNKPYKCKVRSPALHHLQLTPAVAKGHFLADLAAIIGTVDIVFGEIDR